VAVEAVQLLRADQVHEAEAQQHARQRDKGQQQHERRALHALKPRQERLELYGGDFHDPVHYAHIFSVSHF